MIDTEVAVSFAAIIASALNMRILLERHLESYGGAVQPGSQILPSGHLR